MNRGDPRWRPLAAAFYALAHGDAGPYEALPAELKDTAVGRSLGGIAAGERDLIDAVGHELTGTDEWYVYLGRSM